MSETPSRKGPTFNRIIVERVEKGENHRPSGLIVPDTVSDQLAYGIVRKAGPGLRSSLTGELIPLCCQLGDKVRWNPVLSGTRDREFTRMNEILDHDVHYNYVDTFPWEE